MNYQKAHEIISSKGVIDVEFQGKPVWIKNLNKQDGQAEVEFLNTSMNSRLVDISELSEVNM